MQSPAVESQVRKPTRYRLYIDESGDHTYSLLGNPSRRFLGLLGVWFQRPEAYLEYATALEAFKSSIFGPRPDARVVLHRADIINKRGPFGVLKQPEVEQRFNRGLLEVVGKARFKMVCVVIDKKRHKDQYAAPFHPYHYCVAALLERYCGWLNFYNSEGDVCAESRGKAEDNQLRAAYLSIYQGGTFYLPANHAQRTLTSKEIKMRPKAMHTPGLELADILAHPIKMHCLVTKGAIEPAKPCFGDELVRVSLKRFNCRAGTGQIDGYGRVCLWSN